MYTLNDKRTFRIAKERDRSCPPFFLFHRPSPKGIDSTVQRWTLDEHDAGHDTSLIFRAVVPSETGSRSQPLSLPVVIRRLSMQSLKLHRGYPVSF